MSILKLKGSTSGYVELTAPATAGNNTITLPTGSGTVVVGDGSGNVTITGVTTVSAGSTSAPSISPSGDPNTGVFFPAADTIAFAEGGTEAARFDSNGRFGLGTATVDSRFVIRSHSGVSDTPIVKIEHPSNDADFAISGLYDTDGNITYVGSNLYLNSSYAITRFDTAKPSSGITLSGRTGNGEITFLTGTGTAVERMRIDSQGRVNIGNTQGSMDSGADDLVLGTGSGNNGMTIYSGATSSGSIDFANGTSGTNRYQGILFYDHNVQELCGATDNGSTRWRTGSTGFYPNADNSIPVGKSGNRWSAVWAVNGTIQTSDEREKTEITDSALGIDFIKTLHPVSYKWIEGGKIQVEGERDTYQSVPGDRTHWGFIAQEVKQAVDAAGVDFGGWVLTDKDDPDSQQALRYDQFIAPLTKALQEAIAKIETLEAENATLKNDFTALAARVTALESA